MKDQGTRTRAALYERVSREDQTTANQELELRQWAKRLGLKIVKKYTDDGVSRGRRDRPGLTAMLAGAHKRDFDVLLISALDRLGEGIDPIRKCLEQLRAAGVQVRSLKESFVEAGGPTGDLLVAIFAWVAEQERRRIIERTVAGLRRARLAGKTLGRPRLPAGTIDQIKQALARGTGTRATARLVGVGSATVLRVRATMRPRRPRPRRVKPTRSRP